MSIFVGNLPFRAEREDVLQIFAPFGEVLNCSLPLERDTGRKRGFAFVEMADETIESNAIESLQGAELMGRPLRINKAEPRGGGGPRRSGNNNNGYNRGGYNNRGGYGGNNNSGGYVGNNSGGYGGNNNSGGYGGNNSGGYGGGGTYSESNSYASKPSGAEGWEDRSYGNPSDNSEYESGRSRRRRSISNEGNSSNEQG